MKLNHDQTQALHKLHTLVGLMWVHRYDMDEAVSVLPLPEGVEHCKPDEEGWVWGYPIATDLGILAEASTLCSMLVGKAAPFVNLEDIPDAAATRDRIHVRLSELVERSAELDRVVAELGDHIYLYDAEGNPEEISPSRAVHYVLQALDAEADQVTRQQRELEDLRGRVARALVALQAPGGFMDKDVEGAIAALRGEDEVDHG